MVVFKWQNNGMRKGIMKHGRWTNDVGIYAESVVIFQKLRKCFGGRQIIVYFEKNTESGNGNMGNSSPYWSKIKMDKLQGIGKQMEVLFSDTDSAPDLEDLETTSNKETKKLTTFLMELLLDETDSMLDLEIVSECEASSESVIFIFAPANLLCTENSGIGSITEIMELFNDEEIIELVIGKGEDALTSFNATMLVNVEGNLEGIQMELYNSGASRHMSPY